METGGRGAAVSGGRAAAGGCRRKARAAAGTLAADMDLHCDRAAEPPAAEPPSGKINKAAFKLFKKRKPGGTMPSIFGVKNKGDGKGAGLVRSRTHDGLAEALVLEGGRREEPRAGSGDGARPGPAAPRAAPGGAGSAAGASVAKSHSFFSLLRKNGRPESGRAEQADAGPAAGRQKRGLRGLLGGVRWRRKDRRPKDAAPAGRAGAPGELARPGSLTASLECVKEEAPAAAREPHRPGADARPEPAGELAAGEPEPAPACAPGEGAAGPGRAERPRAAPEPRAGEGRPAEDAAGPGAAPAETAQPADSEGGRAPAAPDPSSVDPPSDPSADRICLMFSDVTSLKSFDSLTGCGDIIADPEDEAGPSCAKHAPGPGQPGPAKKPPGVVAYQGGGEEMASPAEADDSYVQEFWDMLSQTEDQGQGPQEGAATAAAAAAPEAQVPPETPKDARCAEGAKEASSVKRRRVQRIPAELQPKEEPKQPDKEPQEGVPNSDEGYWDSTTPGPEEDGARKVGLPRDSDSGDALYDLYAEPDGSPAALPAGEETSCLSRLKPVSPVTVTCPLRTPGSLLKDSKIPISIKHLANLPSSHPVVHQQPARSELPRTKIPVSKVLVRRVSSRGLAGTTLRAAACHDSAKKL
ncbi:APC membrane recruitment protein 2 isoform X1 [Sus scrofa]|uniref:APC membrane recruitment protein 2 isoform X1 n=1 Tax=Sus scrofa TaxID=9823 RepID=UPI000A2B18D4|nr:APC membrane recruitment protein 2 isoform X1 [Sus scrofa]